MTVTYNISPLGSDKNKNILKFSNDQSPNGKRLLLVQDYYSPKDYEVKRVQFGDFYQNVETGGLPYGGFMILWKMVSDLNIKELCVLPLVTWDEERQESTEARKAAYDKALSLVKDCLALNEKKGKPFDGIIFSGYMGLNNEYQNKRVDDLKFGRIFKLKKYMNLPSVFTLPITLIGKDKPDQQEDCAALIGFFYQHVKELLEGKNRYTIDKEGWQGILVKDIQGFKEMMQDIINTPVTSWDTETTGLSRTQETLLTIQIAVSDKKAYVLPWQHKDSPWSAKELEYIRKTLKKYFEFGTWKYHIYQNAKFDIIQFRTHLGIRYYNGSIVDLMSCGFALDENRKFLTLAGYPKPYSLEFVAKNFGAGDIYHEGELGKEDRTTLESEKLEDIAEYGIKDVIIPYQIAAFYFKEAKLRNDKGFVKLVSKQLSDMIFDFTVMEHNGELVDKLYLLKQRDDASELAQKAKAILDKLKGMDSVQKANDILLEKKGIPATAGLFGKRWVFDINKEESQQALFFTVLGIKPLKEKKNGGGALGKDFKEVYKNKYEEVKLLDDYDKIKKIKTTFIDAHFDRFSTDKDLQSDSRIRASYSFTGVVTGRASACVTLDSRINVNGMLLDGNEATQRYNPEKLEVKKVHLPVDTGLGVRRTLNIMYHKNRKVKRFKTERGYSVGVDENTPMLILTPEFELVWKKAKEIQEGERLCISTYHQNTDEEPILESYPEVIVAKGTKNVTRDYPTKMSPELARILGYLGSEGAGLRFGVTDKEIFDDFKYCWKEVFKEDLHYSTRKTINKILYNADIGDVKLVLFFEALGYKCCNCWDKKVPHIMFKSSKESILNYLRAFIDGDGTISNTNAAIYSTSHQLLKDLQILLLHVGIYSQILDLNPKNPEIKEKHSNLHKARDLVITGDNFKKFTEEMKKIKGFKKIPTYKGNSSNNSKDSTIPYIMNNIPKDFIKYLDKGCLYALNGSLTKGKITSSFLWQLKQKSNPVYKTLNYLLGHNIVTSPVVEIKNSIEDVYDFTMYTQNNHMRTSDICGWGVPNNLREGHYLGNGIIVHNSNPNMQQMPSRGEYTKLVKRQFIANPNHLILKADYSAHEVRNWGNVARDEKVGNAFDVGKQLRKELRYYFADDLDEWNKFRQFQKDSHWVVDKGSDIKALDYDQKKALINSLEDKKLKKISQLVFDLENQGDVHKRNYEFFFGVPAYLVTKQQRQAVKSVVFGVIYGKGASTLANDLKSNPVMTREQAIKELEDDGWEPGQEVKHRK